MKSDKNTRTTLHGDPVGFHPARALFVSPEFKTAGLTASFVAAALTSTWGFDQKVALTVGGFFFLSHLLLNSVQKKSDRQGDPEFFLCLYPRPFLE